MHKEKQPAIFKLRMLQEVRHIENVDMHDLLLRHGLMKVMVNCSFFSQIIIFQMPLFARL